MSAPTFCLGIPHTPWVPARVESLTKLLIALGESEADGVLRTRRVFGERALNHVWSEEMWRWGVSCEGRSGGVDPTHFLTLQDDVKVAPNFWPALRAMVEAVPDEVIALEVVHPAAPLLAAKGHRWFTSPDCIVGVGYVLPMAALKEFLAWRAALPDGTVALMVEQKIGEDSLLGLWCTATGRRIWNPLPTIIDHDTELPSTYGHENHAHRRPLVRWDSPGAWNVANWQPDPGANDPRAIEREDYWEPDQDLGSAVSPVPHVGRFPGWCLPQLARQVVPGYSADDFRRHLADDGHETIVPLLYGTRRCWFCLTGEVVAQSHVTTVGMCRVCLSQIAAKLIGG